MTPPHRPHRKLFIVLLAVYVVWMAALLVMYFKTVRPMRTDGLPTTNLSQ